MKHFSVYLLLTLVLSFMSCRKDTTVQPKDYPYVITKNVTNIDSTGATLEANILDFGKDEITDFGFRLNENYQYSLKNTGSFDNFKIRISTDIVNGITYRCRAYVKTTKNLVLGNELSFVGLGSKSPIIEDFNPKEGFDGTLVTLTGKYFSQSGSTKVFVNKLQAEILYSSIDSIVFITPSTDFVGDATISIQIGSQKRIFSSKFKIPGPEIESVSPLSGHPGDSVLIKGNNLIRNGNHISVFFGLYQAEIVSYSNTQVKVIVPSSTNTSLSESVSIKVINGLKVTSQREYFFLIFRQWNSKRAAPFNSEWKNQAFTYNENGYILEEFNTKKLYKYNPNSDQWDSVTSSKFPGDRSVSSLYIVSGDKLLKIGGQNIMWEPINEVWEFSFTNKTWLKKSNIPFKLRNGTFFNLNNQLYIVTDEGQLWKCDFENEQYKRLNNFPGQFAYSFASSFIGNGKAYVVIYEHTWQYNEEADSWIEKSTNPFMNIDYTGVPAIGFSLNGTGFVLDRGNQLYKYDISNDRWVIISQYPGCWSPSLKPVFIIGDIAYIAVTADYGCHLSMYSYQE